MFVRGKKSIGGRVGLLSLFVFLNLAHWVAAEPIVGTWNYATSNHWARGPVPAGKPSKGILVITQSDDQFKMEFKSGMVFNPPQLKYFTGEKKGRITFFQTVRR